MINSTHRYIAGIILLLISLYIYKINRNKSSLKLVTKQPVSFLDNVVLDNNDKLFLFAFHRNVCPTCTRNVSEYMRILDSLNVNYEIVFFSRKNFNSIRLLKLLEWESVTAHKIITPQKFRSKLISTNQNNNVKGVSPIQNARLTSFDFKKQTIQNHLKHFN